LSSHKAVATSDTSTSSTERTTADIALSMLLGEGEGADEAAMPLSAGALRSAHLDDDEDDGAGEDLNAKAGLDDDDDDDDDDGDDLGFGSAGSSDEPSLKPFREDSRVDRRIIEGMLRDRDTFIEEMEHEGFTQAAVLRRAAELGLSEALIRQVKGVAADLAGERPGRRPAPSSLGARTCLSCDRVFLSSGPGNRLCMRCRGGDAGLAQL
jgi:hypothetical protein